MQVRGGTAAPRLLLHGAQVGQHDAEAHGDDEHEHARERLAQAAQQHRVQRGHIRPVARGVEVDIVKVPACQERQAVCARRLACLASWTPGASRSQVRRTGHCSE